MHDDLPAARSVLLGQPYWLTSARSGKSMWEAEFEHNCWIIIGRETKGLPEEWLREEASRVVTIPQVEGERCLNQATAAGIVLFEALRRQVYSTFKV